MKIHCCRMCDYRILFIQLNVYRCKNDARCWQTRFKFMSCVNIYCFIVMNIIIICKCKQVSFFCRSNLFCIGMQMKWDLITLFVFSNPFEKIFNSYFFKGKSVGYFCEQILCSDYSVLWNITQYYVILSYISDKSHAPNTGGGFQIFTKSGKKLWKLIFFCVNVQFIHFHVLNSIPTTWSDKNCGDLMNWWNANAKW